MPSARLREKLAKLGLSTDEPSRGPACGSSSCAASSSRGAGASSSSSSKAPRQPHLTFDVYFPLPPFSGLHFNALKAGSQGYNFTGLLLGVGGRQLQRIKQESQARVEVVNASGNLQGAHPDPLDPTLHAHIAADSMSKLHKAATMVWELLSPTNASCEPIQVVPGGSARLTVLQPPGGPAAGKGSMGSKGSKSSKAKPTHAKASGTAPPPALLLRGGPVSTGSHASSAAAAASSSSSSSSSRGMPVSPPAMPDAPVTPAAVQGGSAFHASSSSSRVSSRAGTPHLLAAASPADSDGLPRSSGGRGGDEHHSSMASLSLGPAALTTLLAGPEDEWPALPSAAANTAASGTHSSSSGGTPASSGVGSAQMASSSRLPASACVSCVRGLTFDDVAGCVGLAAAAAAAPPPLAHACHDHDQDTTLRAATACSSSSDSSVRGADCATCGSAPWLKRVAGGGASDDTLLAASSSADQSDVRLHKQQLPPHAQEQEPCGLDLVALRQRAGLVAQACLQAGEAAGASSSSPLMCGALSLAPAGASSSAGFAASPLLAALPAPACCAAESAAGLMPPRSMPAAPVGASHVGGVSTALGLPTEALTQHQQQQQQVAQAVVEAGTPNLAALLAAASHNQTAAVAAAASSVFGCGVAYDAYATQQSSASARLGSGVAPPPGGGFLTPSGIW